MDLQDLRDRQCIESWLEFWRIWKNSSLLLSLLARYAAEERSCRKFSTLGGRRQIRLSGQTSKNEKCIYIDTGGSGYFKTISAAEKRKREKW